MRLNRIAKRKKWGGELRFTFSKSFFSFFRNWKLEDSISLLNSKDSIKQVSHSLVSKQSLETNNKINLHEVQTLKSIAKGEEE